MIIWRTTTVAISLAALISGVASASFAADEKQGAIFVFTEENDLLSNPFTADHQDRHYTQGLRFTYLGGDDDLPGWAAKSAAAMPAWGLTATATNFGYLFGQNIYTPQDLLTDAVMKNDRPFAGWLYVGVTLQRRGTTGARAVPTLETFEVDLGITGRPSLAQGVQVNFHHWFFTNDTPRGWHNQLATEPGLLLKYQRLWRLSLSDDSAHFVDLIPHVGGDLGNIMIFANAGATARLGYNLPPDFGVQLIDSPAAAQGGTTDAMPPFGFYGFAGADARAVAHNLFLDGNSFRSSPSVDRIPWVADLICGGVIKITRHFELSYTRVVRTHEFVGQDGADRFGSITAKAMFQF